MERWGERWGEWAMATSVTLGVANACLAGAAALLAPKSVGAAFFRTDNRPRVCAVNGQPRRPLEGGALELFALAPHPHKINIAAAMIPTPQEVFMLLRNPLYGFWAALLLFFGLFFSQEIKPFDTIKTEKQVVEEIEKANVTLL